MKLHKLTLLLMLSCLVVSNADAAMVEYTGGHADIGLAYEEGELELHYHFGSGATLDGSPLVGDAEYGPSEAYVRVGDDAMNTTTGDVSFLGTTTGDPAWLLPASDPGVLPFLGIASEELDDMVFSGATLSLTSFSGPGEFALWQNSGLGGENVFWQTNDGLDGSDLLNLAVGGHDHFNYGFTAEGVYDLGVSAVADFSAGGTPATDFGTFRFVVGSATAVPEPGSLAVLAFASVATLVGRRRKSAGMIG